MLMIGEVVLRVSWSTVQEHLKKMEKIWWNGRWISYLLFAENKEMKAAVCNLLLKIILETEPFFNRLVI